MMAHVLKIGGEIQSVFVEAEDRDQVVTEISGAVGYGRKGGALFKTLPCRRRIPAAIRNRPETLKTDPQRSALQKFVV